MELISREAALETLAHNQFVYGENFTSDDPIDKYTVAIIANDIECIAKLPTIDAVPVVRCKDCIHFESEDNCSGANIDRQIERSIGEQKKVKHD